MVEEELEAPKRRLSAPFGERDEVGGAEEPVAVDGTKEFKIARRKGNAPYRGTLETGPAGMGLVHQESA
jgi:hypothetical protein